MKIGVIAAEMKCQDSSKPLLGTHFKSSVAFKNVKNVASQIPLIPFGWSPKRVIF